MSEEELMLRQPNEELSAYTFIPYFLLEGEVSSSRYNDVVADMNHIAWLYDVYEKGSEFLTEGSNNDYTPSEMKFKKASTIMNKEVRFLFSNPPTFNVNRDDVKESNSEKNAVIQSFLDVVLEKNNFNGNLLKGLKDCFIGKRVAIVVNFNEDSGITITFLNSLEFVYETSNRGSGELTKFVSFYCEDLSESLMEQRWFRKRYTKERNGIYVEEDVFSGTGEKIETVMKRTKIKLDYIPVTVVLNDGLTGDTKGCSELEDLIGCESYYSKLSNCDFDALRKSMNPTRYTVDASTASTSSLSTSPGSYWDIQSDDEKSEEKVAKVGMLEANMSYSSPLKTTLDRLETHMYNLVDVPNITSDNMAGVLTSGKTIQAVYWGLTVRCDEKMLAWGHSLRFVAMTVIEGARAYPKCAQRYLVEGGEVYDIPIKITVENNYPIPQDVNEEKEVDLAEVEAKVRSKKSYIKKWQNMTDKKADFELEQIKLEQDMFENSLAASYSGTAGGEGDEDAEEQDGKEEQDESSGQDADEGKEEERPGGDQ